MDFSLRLSEELLRQTPATLHAMLSGLSEDWTATGPEPGAWSPRQVIEHLTHVEESDWIARVQVILEPQGDHAFLPLDREGGFVRFSGWTLLGLLERFATLRSANLETLQGLVTTQDLPRQGTHPSFGDVTLAQLLATWAVHDLNHLGQIVKAMAQHYAQAVGPWREFLPIIDAR